MEHIACTGRIDCLDLESRNFKKFVSTETDAAISAKSKDHGLRPLRLNGAQDTPNIRSASGIALGLTQDVVICLRADEDVQMAVIFIDIRTVIRRVDGHDAACLVHPLAGFDDGRCKLADMQRLCRLDIVLIQI